MSTPPGKLYGLDHLRALAIILVFFFHYQGGIYKHPDWVHTAFSFGWTGVDLFFVLSGFLISSQLFGEIKQDGHIYLKGFFVKRIFRIIPAYIVVVAIYFLFPGFHEREQLPSMWRFATFTQNIGLDIRENGTFSHAWSLCVEEHFYLLLPVTLFLLTARRWLKWGHMLLIFLFLLGLGLRIYCWNELYSPHMQDDDGWLNWFKYIYYPTYSRLDGLLAGVSVAAVYHFLPLTWSRISRYGNLLLLMGVLVLLGAYHMCYNQLSFMASVAGFPIVAAGYGLLVAGAVSHSSVLYKWNSRVLSFVAAISYSFYLTHKGMIHVTQYVTEHFNIDATGNAMLVICIITCTVAAIALHYVIEKPFMRLRKKLL